MPFSLTGLINDWLVDVARDPWPFIMPLAFVILAALLYGLGARYTRQTGIGRPVTTLQASAFAAGLLIALLAVASPFDALADESLPAHMVQHELLIWIAAPLLLLGAPIWPLWRALPLSWRRGSLRWLLGRRWSRQTLTWLGHMGSKPLVAWLLFIVVLLVWHLPPLYDLALEHEAIHALEHLSFLGVALIFWAQVIPSFPLRAQLSYLKRAGYLFGAALVMHVFAIFIDIAATPIYSYYGSGPNAVAMQSAAGAIMDLSSQVVFTIGILTCLWLWLRQDERAGLAATEEATAEDERAAPANLTASGALLIAEADLAEARRADTTGG